MEKKEKAYSRNGLRPRASTADILGIHSKNGKVPAEWSRQYAQLIQLREYLTGQCQTWTASAVAEPTVVGDHIADVATDSYDRDFALSLASSSQELVYEVNEALNRIARGGYGVCELTGRPIERARLEAVPWTRFCESAQAKLEANGAASRTQLGRVRPLAAGSADSDEEDSEANPASGSPVEAKAA